FRGLRRFTQPGHQTCRRSAPSRSGNADRQNLKGRSSMHAPYTNPTAERPAIRVLNGRAFAQELRHATPAGRALLAGAWHAGRILVERPSRPQVSKATGVSLASLAPNRRPTDAAIDKLVTKLGPDRVLAALDRITKPVVVAAE